MSDRPLPRSPLVESPVWRSDTLTHIDRINGPDVIWAPGLPAVAEQHKIEEVPPPEPEPTPAPDTKRRRRR